MQIWLEYRRKWMKTFKDIKYELYEKIDNLLNNGGKIIINVTNKEGTICYNSFLIESTIDRYHSYSYPKITNAKYSDTITPVYWGKEYGNTGEEIRDYWLRHLESHFQKIIGYDVEDVYYSFGDDVEYKGESYNKSKSDVTLKRLEKESKRFAFCEQ